MTYIQLQGGAIVSLPPRPEQITLHDVATGLAHINRFTGHAGAYSVAQHSIYVADVLRDRGYQASVQAAGLLHDAHEAYFGDVSTPLKRYLGLRGADAPFIDAIERRFRVCVRREIVHAVDVAVTLAEADQLLGGRVGEGWPSGDPAPIYITRWTPFEAYGRFMEWADRLEIR